MNVIIPTFKTRNKKKENFLELAKGVLPMIFEDLLDVGEVGFFSPEDESDNTRPLVFPSSPNARMEKQGCRNDYSSSLTHITQCVMEAFKDRRVWLTSDLDVWMRQKIKSDKWQKRRLYDVLTVLKVLGIVSKDQKYYTYMGYFGYLVALEEKFQQLCKTEPTPVTIGRQDMIDFMVFLHEKAELGHYQYTKDFIENYIDKECQAQLNTKAYSLLSRRLYDWVNVSVGLGLMVRGEKTKRRMVAPRRIKEWEF